MEEKTISATRIGHEAQIGALQLALTSEHTETTPISLQNVSVCVLLTNPWNFQQTISTDLAVILIKNLPAGLGVPKRSINGRTTRFLRIRIQIHCGPK